MTARLPQLVVPTFVLACLIAGGSSQSAWGNLLLRLAAIALLLWALWSPAERRSPRPARRLLLLVAAAAGLVLVQLVPLPPGWATALPGRRFVADGFAMLGVQPGWLPLSLAPYRTIEAGVFLLVPAAVAVVMVRTRAWSGAMLAAVVVAGAVLGAMLSALQVSSGGGEQYYLYRHSAFGKGAGFFANSNHMATLLLVALPFLVALASDQWDRRAGLRPRAAVVSLAAIGAVLLGAGILLNGSMAVVLLGAPVALASAMIPRWGQQPRVRRWLLPAGLLAVAAALALAFAFRGWLDPAGNSWSTRATMWSTSAGALRDHGVIGSGAGTFEGIYRRYETVEAVPGTYVNHAHNDYLELAIEMGLPGLLLLAAFLTWWAARSVKAWRRPHVDHYARAAVIGSAAVLVHSLVDFPLRTAAIAALFAACAALLATRPNAKPAADEDDLWPSRHLSVD